MNDWALHDPWWLLALLALPAVMVLRSWRRMPVLVVPFAAEWHRPGSGAPTSWPALLAYLGIALLILALARPQAINVKRETRQQGYDIVLAIDLSESMETPDYVKDGRRISRLQAVKPVLEAFISQRTNDRIGIVVFGTHAYTLAPLTFDHEWLRRQTARLRVGLVEAKTAIGDGLGVALSRIEQGRRESGLRRDGAFVVLLTDGENTAGLLDPRETAALAADQNVVVYTIGAGRYSPFTSDVDEPLLRDIADKTAGKFFRAGDSRTIADAFSAIDQAQKIEFQATSYTLTEELFPRLAVPGLVFLALAAIGAAVQSHREALA